MVKVGTCCMQAKWKAAAERFIEKRGYMAAERLRATLQSEWQQLKAIRQRCCSTVPKVSFTSIICTQRDGSTTLSVTIVLYTLLFMPLAALTLVFANRSL